MYQTCLSAYQYEAGRENLNAKKINREIGFLFFAVQFTVAALVYKLPNVKLFFKKCKK